jgi:hypothetical protein
MQEFVNDLDAPRYCRYQKCLSNVFFLKFLNESQATWGDPVVECNLYMQVFVNVFDALGYCRYRQYFGTVVFLKYLYESQATWRDPAAENSLC